MLASKQWQNHITAVVVQQKQSFSLPLSLFSAVLEQTPHCFSQIYKTLAILLQNKVYKILYFPRFSHKMFTTTVFNHFPYSYLFPYALMTAL